MRAAKFLSSACAASEINGESGAGKPDSSDKARVEDITAMKLGLSDDQPGLDNTLTP